MHPFFNSIFRSSSLDSFSAFLHRRLARKRLMPSLDDLPGLSGDFFLPTLTVFSVPFRWLFLSFFCTAAALFWQVFTFICRPTCSRLACLACPSLLPCLRLGCFCFPLAPAQSNPPTPCSSPAARPFLASRPDSPLLLFFPIFSLLPRQNFSGKFC